MLFGIQIHEVNRQEIGPPLLDQAMRGGQRVPQRLYLNQDVVLAGLR